VLERAVGFDGPEFRAAFSLMKTYGDMMQPGFQQLAREDALYTFMSGRAVTIFTGSWDYNGLVTNSAFPISVTHLPLPAEGDPVFAAGVLGRFSEAALQPEAHFGVTRRSKHRDIAIDFLRFLSSRGVSDRMTRSTLRMSAVLGVEPPPELRDVAPVLDGWIPGVGTTFREVGGGHTRKLFQINFYRLFGVGTVDDFARTVEAGARETLRLDLERTSVAGEREAGTHDARIGLLLTRGAEGDLDAALRLLELQHPREWEAHELREATRVP
jgi:multiple sugar transport system substrate-binding protein/raffinose/stachyose/melibiose transport system substrate-binding protein